MKTNLKAIREKKGLSLRGLAQRSGVDWTTIHRIEQERADPRLSTLATLAKALGIRVRDLLQ